MAKFYDADEVKRTVSIREYLNDQGVKMHGNRCVAVWRGGDDTSCAIYDTNGENNVYDNKGVRRLNVIDLCMEIEGKSFTEAKIALGERYGVTATGGTKRPAKKSKRKVEPNWVRVSWLIIHADDEGLMEDARRHLNEGGDYLTDADLEWARRVAELLTDRMRGATLNDAIMVAVEMRRQIGKEVA